MGSVCNGHETFHICLPVGDFDDLDVDQFVEESLKMSRFKHAHVMGLIGVCLDAGPAPYILMPYMANGSLLKYLKRERKNLVFTDDADEDEVGIIIAPVSTLEHPSPLSPPPPPPPTHTHTHTHTGIGSSQAFDGDVFPDS